MITKLVQNTLSIRNKTKKIHIYYINVPHKKRWQFPTNYNIILHVVAKDNNIFELNGPLET